MDYNADHLFGSDGSSPTPGEEPKTFDIGAYKQRIAQAVADNAAASAARPVKHGERRITEKEFFLGSTPPAKRDFNERAKTWMRRMGWDYERVDYFDARTTRHHDLLGMFDYIAFTQEGVTVGVQITAAGQVSTRKQKILNEPKLAFCRRCGWKALVLGFGNDKEVREVWVL